MRLQMHGRAREQMEMKRSRLRGRALRAHELMECLSPRLGALAPIRAHERLCGLA